MSAPPTHPGLEPYEPEQHFDIFGHCMLGKCVLCYRSYTPCSTSDACKICAIGPRFDVICQECIHGQFKLKSLFFAVILRIFYFSMTVMMGLLLIPVVLFLWGKAIWYEYHYG